jgi:NAD-dependent dihydropyrimidine dehydrogenase PreA subunit
MKYLANVTTLKFFPDKCAGCGRCVEVCPQGVFEMRDKRAAVTDKDLCMECGACAMNCDFDAIINGMVTGGEPSCGCGDSSAGCCG